ncbi:hypothetical protein GCM10028824_18430 [Hymenobacter segetis]|uniref:Uncharacterized protein n=1 Tax=Hymenobacter segetis TaxID=2025509 RepID=A0ABU9M3M3_9BACT
MLVWGLLFLLVWLGLLAVALYTIRRFTTDAPVWRAGLTVWLLAGAAAWLGMQFEHSSLPNWLTWLPHRGDSGLAAVLAAPLGLLAALLARFRYHYPE